MSALQSVVVSFSCPACGADGYEEEFTAADVDGAVQMLLPCDECPARITLDVGGVSVQADTPPASEVRDV